MNERLLRMLKMNDVEYKIDQELSVYSSIKIGGIAGLVILPDTVDKLVLLLDYFTEEGLPFKVLGRMTNVLPPDVSYDTPIITTRRLLGFSVDNSGNVTASGGEMLMRIIRKASDYGLGGLETLSGIPGTLGGLVSMNAGAFGAEISDFFKEAYAYDIKGRRTVVLSLRDMRFSYRHSILRDGGLVLLSATLSLKEKTKEDVISDVEKYRSMRLDTQPTSPSLGSVFLRSEGVIPARLIDEAGLRGARVGGAEVSRKHAGFIVNAGGASAEDFKLLVDFVKSTVYLRFGVELSEEVECL